MIRGVGTLGTALLLLAGCGDNDPSQSTTPTAEAWKQSSRAAAASIEAGWLQSRVAVLAADSMEGRDNLTAGGARARAWLKQQMNEIGLQPLGSGGFEQAFAQGVNLIGRIPGKDPQLADEYVVVSGHYDHLGVVGAPNSQCRSSRLAPGDSVCNGAVDNAAGSVATLAVANALARSRHGTRRSILVALWDAEEDGLLGSHYFADQDPRVPLDKIAAMYSVDNVGGYFIQGVEESFAIGTEYATGLRELVKAVNDETGYTHYPVSSFFVGSDTGGRSDHLPFRLRGVPIIFFGSGSPRQYHTPADEIGVVSFDKLTRITRHVTLLTADVANADSRPSFVSEPEAQLDDAKALLNLARVVRADPSSLGIDDPVLLGVVDNWIVRLERYIVQPPTNAGGWAAYQSFLKVIITTVYSTVGGASHHPEE